MPATTGPGVRIIAHRGHSAAAPENTPAAFRAAAAMDGVDLIECDVRLSADGVPVIIHDRTVERTTDGTGEVSELSLDQLRGLDAGSWFAPQFAGQRIPTLAEYLDAISGKTPLIEVKDPAAAPRVAVELDRRGLLESAVVQSFHLEALGRLRRERPTLRLGCLVVVPPEAQVRRQAAALGIDLLVCLDGVLHLRSLKACLRTGFEVWSWTVNDPARMAWLIDHGVTGLITDDPALVPAGRNGSLPATAPDG